MTKELCQKWEFEAGDTLQDHWIEGALETEKCKILWAFPHQIDKKLVNNRPGITIIDKEK